MSQGKPVQCIKCDELRDVPFIGWFCKALQKYLISLDVHTSEPCDFYKPRGEKT